MKAYRTYRGKDVNMLTACSVIVDTALANQDYLVSKRAVWASPFFNNLKTRIDGSLDLLGTDVAAEQRQSTQFVLSIQTNAISDLQEVKIQIDEDFKSDKIRHEEILKNLGYAVYYKNTRSKDQEALVQLLFRFKDNLSPTLRNELETKGVSTETLDRIVSYATDLHNANVTQERLKNIKHTLSAEILAEFNALYSDVIGIAKIARNFYKGNPSMLEAFSYTKVYNKLNVAPKPKK
ncbi:MAG: hypothetical protein LBR10_05910 [Prevotellaceae bacterium]|jgi:endonuclease III-like uncharacterized protein|nr:hypothetical protein [Prevotellaceae bacterium]